MEIIRNCSHYSSVQTAIELDGRDLPAKIIKTAFNKEGAKCLKNEYRGMAWYCQRRGVDSAAIMSHLEHGNSFVRLEVSYIKGECGKLGCSLRQNYKRMHNAITHYVDIFLSPDCGYRHGDYSLENIVFNGDSAAWLLDWESFNDALPEWFDPVLCVMDTCFFRFRKTGGLSRDDIKVAVCLLQYISEQIGLPEGFISEPSQRLRSACLDAKDILGPQLQKYPFINYSLEEIVKIDSYFKKESQIGNK